ncbi:MAG: DNA alkylation repair protein [Paracoccaceae bacterium]|nr:DNA alkylation repair protein [Paracoccaceae bacterium]
MTAADLITELKAARAPGDAEDVARFYTAGDPDTRILGLRIPKIFPIAKAHRDIALSEVETLLDDPHYEVRMAAMTILDAKARLRSSDHEALFNLYLAKIDRIDNWDLVDRAAPFVIGEYLLDRDRSPLDTLAASPLPQARRTAIVATYAFLKRGQTDDTFRLADILAEDPHPYVQKALGSWLREAGKRDPEALSVFLAANANRLPRPTITTAGKALPEAG